MEQSPEYSEECLMNENQSYLEKIAIVSNFPPKKFSEARSKRLKCPSPENSTNLVYKNLEGINSNKSSSVSGSPSSNSSLACNSISEMEKYAVSLSACSMSTFNMEKSQKSDSQNSLPIPVIGNQNSDGSVQNLDDSLDEVDELENTVIYNESTNVINNDLISFTSDEELDNNKTITSDSSSMPPAFIELLKSLQSPKKQTQSVSSSIEVASSSTFEKPEPGSKLIFTTNSNFL